MNENMNVQGTRCQNRLSQKQKLRFYEKYTSIEWKSDLGFKAMAFMTLVVGIHFEKLYIFATHEFFTPKFHRMNIN